MTAVTRAFVTARDGLLAWPRWAVYTAGGAALIILLGLPTIIIPPATDQVLYAMGARTILHGGQLYRDLWEIKPPLIYLVYAAPLGIFGERMEAVRALDLVNTGLAMAAVFFLTRRLFSERAGLLAAGFYGFTYLTWARYDGLGEAESFMAAPLAFAFLLYLPDDRAPRLRTLTAGVCLGAAFALKSTALLFVLGFPAAELLLRDGERWSLAAAAQRLAITSAGFLAVQAAFVVYLAAGNALGDFIDIQRHYTAPYNAYRYPPGFPSHVRFLLQGTSDWVRDMPFLVVPAAAGTFFACFRSRDARAVAWLSLTAALGVAGVWWQGKLFHYHWLIMIPLLAPLAGYAVDQLLALFGSLARVELRAASALLAIGLLVLAFDPLLATYDNYRTLVNYTDGSLDRRQVEARYDPLLATNHQLVDYVKAHGGPDDRLFIWGLWPVAYWWLDRPLVDRFVANHGLRGTWTPDSWRRELLEDLTASPPRFFAVAYGDNQPWLVGTSETSDQHLDNSFPELRNFLLASYVPVLDLDLFVLYERTPLAVERAPATAR